MGDFFQMERSHTAETMINKRSNFAYIAIFPRAIMERKQMIKKGIAVARYLNVRRRQGFCLTCLCFIPEPTSVTGTQISWGCVNTCLPCVSPVLGILPTLAHVGLTHKHG